MTYFLWFLIAFSVLALGYGYVGWRLIVPSQLPQPWNTIAWVTLIVLFLVPLATVILEINRIRHGWSDLFVWVGYVTLGLFSFVLTFVLMRDLAWLAIAGGQKLVTIVSGLFTGQSQSAGPTDPHRRQVLVQAMNVTILAVSGGLTAYGFYQARRRPAIVEVNVPITNLPHDLEGFRIVQITDIHAGLTVTREFVETVVAMANELKGDIIAFTGDLVDGTVDHLREHVEPVSRLSARYGSYFITGNHEYYSGAEPWVEEAKRLGFDVLLNEHRVLRHGNATILLAGVTDSSAGQFVPSHASDPHKAIAGAPPSDVKILLAHQPRSLYEAVKAGFHLQISGHTHGGQFFPWNLVAAAGQPFIKGLHKYENSWIYVSKGTGYWGPPVRIGARSEITAITLTADRSVSS
jgi:hypothetical protein